MPIRIILALVCALWAGSAQAQQVRVAPSGCPPGAGSITSTSALALWVDANGNLCASTKPTALTLVPLDVATVTTGATAVTALAAGHRTAGGWIYNPSVATVNLCINEVATAACTTSSGSCTCILPGATYNIAPAAGAVSVITSDSSHPFSGFGFQ